MVDTYVDGVQLIALQSLTSEKAPTPDWQQSSRLPQAFPLFLSLSLGLSGFGLYLFIFCKNQATYCGKVYFGRLKMKWGNNYWETGWYYTSPLSFFYWPTFTKRMSCMLSKAWPMDEHGGRCRQRNFGKLRSCCEWSVPILNRGPVLQYWVLIWACKWQLLEVSKFESSASVCH